MYKSSLALVLKAGRQNQGQRPVCQPQIQRGNEVKASTKEAMLNELPVSNVSKRVSKPSESTNSSCCNQCNLSQLFDRVLIT